MEHVQRKPGAWRWKKVKGKEKEGGRKTKEYKDEPRILTLATRDIHYREGFIEYSLNTGVESLSSLEKTEKSPVGR